MATRRQFPLRLDQDVYFTLKGMAEEGGVSMNQLVEGILRWAGRHGHSGEPIQVKELEMATRDQPGHFWFGDAGGDIEVDESGDRHLSEPKVVFELDFNARRSLIDD